MQFTCPKCGAGGANPGATLTQKFPYCHKCEGITVMSPSNNGKIKTFTAEYRDHSDTTVTGVLVQSKNGLPWPMITPDEGRSWVWVNSSTIKEVL